MYWHEFKLYGSLSFFTVFAGLFCLPTEVIVVLNMVPHMCTEDLAVLFFVGSFESFKRYLLSPFTIYFFKKLYE